MMPRSRNYQDELLTYLQDPERSIAYLNAALEEGDPEFLVMALQNVAQANGKTIDHSLLNQSARLDWSSLIALLKELGLDLTITARSKAA